MLRSLILKPDFGVLTKADEGRPVVYAWEQAPRGTEVVSVQVTKSEILFTFYDLFVIVHADDAVEEQEPLYIVGICSGGQVIPEYKWLGFHPDYYKSPAYSFYQIQQSWAHFAALDNPIKIPLVRADKKSATDETSSPTSASGDL